MCEPRAWGGVVAVSVSCQCRVTYETHTSIHHIAAAAAVAWPASTAPMSRVYHCRQQQCARRFGPHHTIHHSGSTHSTAAADSGEHSVATHARPHSPHSTHHKGASHTRRSLVARIIQLSAAKHTNRINTTQSQSACQRAVSFSIRISSVQTPGQSNDYVLIGRRPRSPQPSSTVLLCAHRLLLSSAA